LFLGSKCVGVLVSEMGQGGISVEEITIESDSASGQCCSLCGGDLGHDLYK
jgi:hypothetical protein